MYRMNSRFFPSLAIVCASLAAFAAEQPRPATTHSVNISPTSITFPNQDLGKTYAAQTVNITNTGTATLTMASFALTGPFCWSSGLAPQSFGTNYDATITVLFCPTVVGTQTGTLTITFNQLPGTYTVNLTGTAANTTAKASFSSTNVAFNNVPVGSTATQSVTVTNTGKGSFNLASIFITPPIFAVTNTFPITLRLARQPR